MMPDKLNRMQKFNEVENTRHWQNLKDWDAERWNEWMSDGKKQLNFENKDLSNLDLSGRNLSYINMILADLTNTNLSNCDLTHVKFSGAKLEGVNFEGTNLTRAEFNSHNFTRFDIRKPENIEGIKFEGIDFNSCDFSKLEMKNAKFLNCKLWNANFEKSKLHGSDFTGSNLQVANFSNAILKNASFYSCKLGGCNFSKANLSLVDLRDTHCDEAIFHKTEGLYGRFQANMISDLPVRGAENAKYTYKYDKWLSWSHIRLIGSLPLFGISYLAIISIWFWVAGTQWMNARFAEVSPIGDPWIQTLNPIPLPDRMGITFSALGSLALATTFYKLFCPSEIQEYTETRWVYELGQPRLSFRSLAYSRNILRWLTATFYLGGFWLAYLLLIRFWETANYLFFK